MLTWNPGRWAEVQVSFGHFDRGCGFGGFCDVEEEERALVFWPLLAFFES